MKTLHWTVGMMIVVVPLLLAVGCNEQKSSPKTGSVSTASLPAGLILAEAPGGAVSIAQARLVAKPGDTVVVQGRIGGSKEPFVSDRAIFQVVDMSMPPCAEAHGCETPWDYCCEPHDQVAAKSMTVQVIGADGKPLALDLPGKSSLKPMDKIIVRGKVANKAGDAVMIVNADGIYVVQSPASAPAK